MEDSPAPLVVSGPRRRRSGTSPPPAVRPDDPTTATLSLPCTSSATSEARHWTDAQLRRRGARSVELREDAELIVSELVSNAILYGLPPITVTLVDTPEELLVSVADSGGPPYLFGSRSAEPTASHGRGLAIVASLAVTWGIRAQDPGPGKTVWVSLHTTAAASR